MMESVRKAIGQRIEQRVVERGAWFSGIQTKRYSSTRAAGRVCSGLIARWPKAATIRQLQIRPAPLHKAQCQLAPECHNVNAPRNMLVCAVSSGQDKRKPTLHRRAAQQSDSGKPGEYGWKLSSIKQGLPNAIIRWARVWSRQLRSRTATVRAMRKALTTGHVPTIHRLARNGRFRRSVSQYLFNRQSCRLARAVRRHPSTGRSAARRNVAVLAGYLSARLTKGHQGIVNHKTAGWNRPATR